MCGSTPIEAADVDAICEFVRDFKQEYQKNRSLQGDERVAGMKAWFDTILPERLQALQARLGENGYAVGTQTSLADIAVYTFVTQFFDDTVSSRKAAAAAPKVHAIVERVGALPQVRAWLASRPETPF